MMPKTIRLKLEKDIKRAARGGAVFSGPLVLRFVKTRNENSRFVIVVSTKVSKRAVVRNLIRRRLAAIFTKAEPLLLAKIDAMVTVKAATKDLDFDQLRLQVWDMFLKARLVSPSLLRKN